MAALTYWQYWINESILYNLVSLELVERVKLLFSYRCFSKSKSTHQRIYILVNEILHDFYYLTLTINKLNQMRLNQCFTRNKPITVIGIRNLYLSNSMVFRLFRFHFQLSNLNTNTFLGHTIPLTSYSLRWRKKAEQASKSLPSTIYEVLTIKQIMLCPRLDLKLYRKRIAWFFFQIRFGG